MDDMDLAFGIGDSDSGQSGQGQEKPLGDSGTPDSGAGDGSASASLVAKESTPGDGTAKPGAQASATGKEEPKGVLPKELEPHKDLFDSKKFDLTKPEGVAKLAQAYKEIESHAGKTSTQSKNSQDKAARVMSIASGSVEDLNKWRKSQGLSELPIDTRSHEDRVKEVDDLYSNVDKALNGDPESLKWLNNHFAKQRESLLESKLTAKNSQNKTADQAFNERKSVARANFASMVQANPEAKGFFDELTDHLSPGGVFDSMGFDVLDAASTPERLAAFVEMGQALNVFRNLEKVVEGRVTAELERRRAAGNAGGGAKEGAKGAIPKESLSEFDTTTVF